MQGQAAVVEDGGGNAVNLQGPLLGEAEPADGGELLVVTAPGQQRLTNGGAAQRQALADGQRQAQRLAGVDLVQADD